MFCCNCGAPNPDSATYCHKCGGSLYKKATESQQPRPTPNTLKPEPKLTQEQRQLVEELFSIDEKPHECHACGRTENLYSCDFGLAKKTGTKRDWSMTALSVVVSVVTLPLLGAGVLELPGKKTHLNVLRLHLVLCYVCRNTNFAYYFHPWWEPAKRLGFTEFYDAEQLKKLQPVR
jgi:hypothetical protein